MAKGTNSPPNKRKGGKPLFQDVKRPDGDKKLAAAGESVLRQLKQNGEEGSLPTTPAPPIEVEH